MDWIKKSSPAFFYSFFAVFSSFILNFLTQYILIRSFPTGEFAYYSFGSNLQMILLMIAGFGVGTTIIKELSSKYQGKDRIHKLISAGFLLTVIISSIPLIFTILLSNFFETLYDMNNLGIVVVQITIFTFCINIETYFESCFRGLQNFKNYFLINIILNISKLFIVLTVFFFPISIINIILYLMIYSIIHSSLLVIFINKKYQLLNTIRFLQIKDLKSFFNFSIIVFFPGLFAYAYQRFNFFIIGIYVSASGIAIYGTTLLIVDILSIPILVLSVVILPTISKYMNIKDIGQKNTEYLFNFVIKYGLLMMIPFVTISWLLVDNGILSILGEDYSAIIHYIKPFLIYLNIKIVGVAGVNFLYAANQPKTALKLTGITACVSVISSYLFIPYFLIDAAIYSIVIPHSVYILLTLSIVKRRNKIIIPRATIFFIIKIIISTILSYFLTIMIFSLFLKNMEQIISIILLFLVFGTLFILFTIFFKIINKKMIEFMIFGIKRIFSTQRQYQ